MADMMEMKGLDLNELEKATGAGEGIKIIPPSVKTLIRLWVYVAKEEKNLPKEEGYVHVKEQLDKMAKNLFDEEVLHDLVDEIWNSL